MRAGIALVGCVLLAACGGTVVDSSADPSPKVRQSTVLVTDSTISDADGVDEVSVREIDPARWPTDLARIDGITVDASKPSLDLVQTAAQRLGHEPARARLRTRLRAMRSSPREAGS